MWWWSGLVPVRFAFDGEARSRPAVTVAGGPCTERYRSTVTSVLGRAVLPLVRPNHRLRLQDARAVSCTPLGLGWRGSGLPCNTSGQAGVGVGRLCHQGDIGEALGVEAAAGGGWLGGKGAWTVFL